MDLFDHVIPKRPKPSDYEMVSFQKPAAPQKHKPFARRHISMAITLAAGLLVCLGVIAYTKYVSVKLMYCPAWAIDCRITKLMELNKNNIALVQGIVTIIYSVDLVTMTYAAHGLAESALWPLLSVKHMSIDQIEAYLSMARGSLPMHRSTIGLFTRTAHTTIIMLVAVLVALTPLFSGPLVGKVYARVDHAQPLRSSYKVGNGIGRIYAQVNPPVSVGAESLSSYISWSKGLSQEPLNEIREWIVDRSALRDIGNITVHAIRTKLVITCEGFHPALANPVKNKFATFSTKMASHNLDRRMWNSSGTVDVSIAQSMVVWVDDLTFIHANRSSAVLVFTALNGTIESGTASYIPRKHKDYPLSSIACLVDVEFVDDILRIGDGGPSNVPSATLSSIQGTHIAFKNSSNDNSKNTLNENALWFAVAPVLVAPSIQGAQPLYYRETDTKTGLPVPYSKAPYVDADNLQNDWTVKEIENFIRVFVGSVAQASSRNFKNQHPKPENVTSLIYLRKLDTGRVSYLIIPMLVILIGETVLLYSTVRLHERQKVPLMRMAPISELLNSCWTDFFLKYYRILMYTTQRSSQD
jgi:hypothetical protein